MPLAPRIPIELTMSRYHLRVDLGPKGPVRSLSISLASRTKHLSLRSGTNGLHSSGMKMGSCAASHAARAAFGLFQIEPAQSDSGGGGS